MQPLLTRPSEPDSQEVAPPTTSSNRHRRAQRPFMSGHCHGTEVLGALTGNLVLSRSKGALPALAIVASIAVPALPAPGSLATVHGRPQAAQVEQLGPGTPLQAQAACATRLEES